MINMADMFGKITDIQKKMEEARNQLHLIEVEAESGGGMVKVKANGNREVTMIKLDKALVDPNDPEMLEDLIVAAVNQAMQKAEEAAKEKLSEVTQGMIPGGLDLSRFGL
ncbi:YbaB/EbfC family nucleoid-associated protein [Balneolaceae bacterium ANBcel3]|nr:YbaB/EbfC family nucleoid-associated protein [Balneolaceae bacterium ANBcel3]